MPVYRISVFLSRTVRIKEHFQTISSSVTTRHPKHEHIILLTEGRFLMLAVLAVMVWLPYLFVRDRMAGMMLAWWEIPFLLLVEVSLYYALLRQFWYS